MTHRFPAPRTNEDPGTHLNLLVHAWAPRLAALPDELTATRPATGGWSARELLGHLVDSATINQWRFVEARFREDLVFPPYDQDAWVTAQRWQQHAWAPLVELWRLAKLHLAEQMAHTPEDIRLKPRLPHNLDRIAWGTLPAEQPVTLQYFMEDYVGHMEHHLSRLHAILKAHTP